MFENLLKRMMVRVPGAYVVLALAVACADAQAVHVKRISTVPSHARRELTEGSAAAMSARQAGLFFTINDSGNEPLLFAMDTTGADRGTWRVAGAKNVDWESLAIGPCASATDAGRPMAGVPACVYIGDTGDNRSRLPTRSIYRVAEPVPLAAGATGRVSAERVTYVYEDAPHDVEAMYVAPNGDMFLITKRPIPDRRTRGVRPTLIYRLPANAWMLRGNVVAHVVDSLEAPTSGGPLRQVTDASLSTNAGRLAVRTYKEVYVYSTDSATGRVKHAIAPVVCDVRRLGEFQGEGVTWVGSGDRLLFTSEGSAAPLHLADCR